MKQNELENQSSEVLCAKIVAYRVLKIGKEDFICCMQILEQRKIDGSNFDYISYIEEKIKIMPKPTIGKDKIQNIKSVLKNVKSGTF